MTLLFHQNSLFPLEKISLFYIDTYHTEVDIADNTNNVTSLQCDIILQGNPPYINGYTWQKDGVDITSDHYDFKDDRRQLIIEVLSLYLFDNAYNAIAEFYGCT